MHHTKVVDTGGVFAQNILAISSLTESTISWLVIVISGLTIKFTHIFYFSIINIVNTLKFYIYFSFIICTTSLYV